MRHSAPLDAPARSRDGAAQGAVTGIKDVSRLPETGNANKWTALPRWFHGGHVRRRDAGDGQRKPRVEGEGSTMSESPAGTRPPAAPVRRCLARRTAKLFPDEP